MEILEKVKSLLPKEAVSRVELEGSEIIVYTKDREFFRGHEDTIRQVVSQIKKRIEVRPEKNLVLDEEADTTLVNKVIASGYAPDLNDTEVEQVGQDPFLISYGLRSPNKRIVVSNEVSKPSKKRANRKVPDVCASLNVACQNNFSMLRSLGFRTGWRAS